MRLRRRNRMAQDQLSNATSKSMRKRVEKNKSLSKVSETTCTICLTEVPSSKAARIESCGHKFCLECIRDWASKCENSCPNCKLKFTKIYFGKQTLKVADKELTAEAENFECFVCKAVIMESEEDQAFICEVCNDLAVHKQCLKNTGVESDSEDFCCNGCEEMLATLEESSSEAYSEEEDSSIIINVRAQLRNAESELKVPINLFESLLGEVQQQMKALEMQ